MAADSILTALGDIANWGALGFVVFGLVGGLLVPSWTYKDKSAEAKGWKDLYESERTAHTATREAFATQGERLQVAVESGRVTEALLREARSRAVSPAQD